MISEFYLATLHYPNLHLRGSITLQLVISVLGPSRQLRQFHLDSRFFDAQVLLKQYGITSLLHGPDSHAALDDPIDDEELVRLVRLPTLRRLELDYMPRWNSGVPPDCRPQNVSSITTLFLHRAWLGRDLRYVFAWFKSLQVLEIGTHDTAFSHAATQHELAEISELHADQILQWLITRRTTHKNLAIMTSEVTGPVAQPLGTGVREFVGLEHLICSIELLTEKLSARWHLQSADEVAEPEILCCTPGAMLPASLQTLEILLSPNHCYYRDSDMLPEVRSMALDGTPRASYETRRLFAWLENISTWAQARFPYLKSLVVHRSKLADARLRHADWGGLPWHCQETNDLNRKFEQQGITLTFTLCALIDGRLAYDFLTRFDNADESD